MSVPGSIVAAIVALGLSVSMACGLFKTNYEEIPPAFPDPGAVAVLDTLDFNYVVSSLEGEDIPLSSFEGRVMFVNIWGTWCGPCRSELPGIQKLYDSMKDGEVAFLLLSNESPETLRSFLEAEGYALPVYVYTDPLPGSLKATSFPTTYIVDQDGMIVFKYKLTAKWNDPSTERFLKYVSGRSALSTAP